MLSKEWLPKKHKEGNLTDVFWFLSDSYQFLVITFLYFSHHTRTSPFQFLQHVRRKVKNKACRHLPYLPGTSFMLWFSEAFYWREKKKLKTISNFQSNKNIEKWKQIILQKCDILQWNGSFTTALHYIKLQGSIFKETPATSKFLELHSLTANIPHMKQYSTSDHHSIGLSFSDCPSGKCNFQQESRY